MQYRGLRPHVHVKRCIGSGLVLVVLMNILAPELARATTLNCDESLVNGAVRCVVDESRMRTRSGPDDGAGQWPPDGWRLVEYPVYSTDEEGEPCLRRVQRYIAPGEPLPVGETAPWFEFNHPSVPPDDFTWADCPPRAQDRPPDTDVVIERFSTELRRTLPAPRLAVAPGGYALTGLPAYLETGDRQLTISDRITLVTPGWEIEVDFNAEGRYTVDWGDHVGQRGPYEVAGTGYPEGVVRHAYQFKGEYDVLVVDDWDVDVSVPGLPPMRLGYEIGYPPLRMRVEELRAVRVATRASH